MKHGPAKVTVAFRMLEPHSRAINGVMHPAWICKGSDWVSRNAVKAVMEDFVTKGHMVRCDLDDLFGPSYKGDVGNPGRPLKTAYKLTSSGHKEMVRITDEWKALPDEP